MLTKGFMMRELKKVGVRKGDKNGLTVQLEHLKSFEVSKLYHQYCK